ncbi:uncharacterized protein LOC121391265 [Gigantopelta aegis]|uniref:uncharacterized protein LOC121391265 n=1 Tax=Gigantopelta aegis TaxID=1735272 RepID=UPI001B88780F|nr:uncharacterized protein LOC121391265 [Gigantopelta aegis]
MNSWLRVWAQSGVLILQLLRLPAVSALSLSTAPHQGHTVSLKSQQLFRNGPFLFHYNPWQVLRWPLAHDIASKLDRLTNVRSQLFGKEMGLASKKKPSKISRKRQKEKSLVNSWLPAAQIRSGLQYALHPEVLDSIVSFDHKSHSTPGVAQTKGQKDPTREGHGKDEGLPRLISPSIHKLQVHKNTRVHDIKLLQPTHKGNPTHRNSGLPKSNAFEGFGSYQYFDMMPADSKEQQFGGSFDMGGPHYFSDSDVTPQEQGGDLWMNAGSGQIKGSFGAVQSFEGHFVDESRDCDVIDKKTCFGDDDCLCYGLYECSTNRCVPLSVSSADTSNPLGGFWHEEPMEIMKKRKSSKAMKIK